jgi:2-oxoglutarate dehydrogenase complex dehydrogenase (E1) component-like enzyme
MAMTLGGSRRANSSMKVERRVGAVLGLDHRANPGSQRHDAARMEGSLHRMPHARTARCLRSG